MRETLILILSISLGLLGFSSNEKSSRSPATAADKKTNPVMKKFPPAGQVMSRQSRFFMIRPR